MKAEFLNKIYNFSFNRTVPFCISCYTEAQEGVCPYCHSDDLGRWMDGIGLDWSMDFAIEYILQEKFAPVDIEQTFEEMIRSCYSEETIVGWMKFNTCELMKSQDPISWRIARDEYINELVSKDEIMTFDNGFTYYRASDLEKLLN